MWIYISLQTFVEAAWIKPNASAIRNKEYQKCIRGSLGQFLTDFYRTVLKSWKPNKETRYMDKQFIFNNWTLLKMCSPNFNM